MKAPVCMPVSRVGRGLSDATALSGRQVQCVPERSLTLFTGWGWGPGAPGPPVAHGTGATDQGSRQGDQVERSGGSPDGLQVRREVTHAHAHHLLRPSSCYHEDLLPLQTRPRPYGGLQVRASPEPWSTQKPGREGARSPIRRQVTHPRSWPGFPDSPLSALPSPRAAVPFGKQAGAVSFLQNLR